MLVLLLRTGNQRLALDVADVVEVVPWVPLGQAPPALDGIAGLLRHREGMVPVADLARLVRGAPCAPLLSTRIVLLRRTAGDSSSGLVGLLAEGATETLRVDDAPLHAAGLHTRAAPWPGPITLDHHGIIRLVRWTDLVPTALRAAILDGADA